MIQWNYLLTKQNWPACELEFATIQQVLICLRVQVTEPFEKRALADFFKESYRVLSLATTRLRKNDWVKIPFQKSPIEKFDTIDLVSRATIRG